jgi:hypothetical protein
VVALSPTLLTLVTLSLYPAAPSSAGGPTADPTHVVPPTPQLLVDEDGCLVDFDRALAHRMICGHDLGPVWSYDTTVPAAEQARVLCINGTQVFGDAVPSPAPRYLDDGRRRAQEWLRVYPTASQARAAFDQLLAAKPCGLVPGAVASPVMGLTTPVGADAAQAFSVVDAYGVCDVMLLLVDDAVVQVSVAPMVTGLEHDPDVLQLVALTAVARYRSSS